MYYINVLTKSHWRMQVNRLFWEPISEMGMSHLPDSCGIRSSVAQTNATPTETASHTQVIYSAIAPELQAFRADLLHAPNVRALHLFNVTPCSITDT